MNKLLKLKLKISKLDELMEKEMSKVALFVNIRNSIYEEFKQATKAVLEQSQKVETLLKENAVILEYKNLIEKLSLIRENLETCNLVVQTKRPFAHKKMFADRAEGLLRDCEKLEAKKEKMKNLNPILMYIQETDELEKLKGIENQKNIFFEKSKLQAEKNGEGFRKMGLLKAELQKEMRALLAREK